jgi:short subunit dehydrogenase-like uncharacterized protein
MPADWLLYGAYGYTGELVAEQAVRRGHRPLLAGRSGEKLEPVAHRLGLEFIVLDLQEHNELVDALKRVELVFHAAGPFVHTSEPMIQACLTTGTHYLDISGEIPVFQNTFSRDQAALRCGIALISGAGFDVIPTDCLADLVAHRVPNAVKLETAVNTTGGASAGTLKTSIELFPQGGYIRRSGELVPHPFGKGAKRIRFSHGQRWAVPAPWGDLVTAYQTTSIPNITAYSAFPKRTIRLMRWTSFVGEKVLGLKVLRRALQKWIDRSVEGPDAQTRQSERSYIWARATDAAGKEAQAWLETVETYRFTAIAGVRCVEKVLQGGHRGALTPALAFGADFILEIEDTQRFEALTA